MLRCNRVPLSILYFRGNACGTNLERDIATYIWATYQDRFYEGIGGRHYYNT